MTVVVAARLLGSIVVVADCRVSYEGTAAKDDELQKLYQIGGKTVLGFTGPLDGAYEVLEAVRKNSISYSKPDVSSGILHDLERWIRHSFSRLANESCRRGLAFILASVEPTREQRSRWITSFGAPREKPPWFPYVPELRVVSLKCAGSSSEKLSRRTKSHVQVIGVPPSVHSRIETTIDRLYGFSSTRPQQQAQVITDSLMAVLMEEDTGLVGGLFQCALLGETGVDWLTYGLPSQHGDVSLELREGRYTQIDNVSGRIVSLKTIWEFMEHQRKGHVPGETGIFEYPGLRRAITDRDRPRD